MSDLNARGRAALTFAFIGASTALLWSPAASAQGYALSSGTGSYSSIVAGGTALGLVGQDDAAAALSAPFAFPLFGVTIASGTSLYASSNGTLAIGSSYSDYSNGSLPGGYAGVPLLAPFWDDLLVPTTTDVYAALVGSGSSAELVVEWASVRYYTGASDTFSFQVRISADGVVRYAYGPRNVLEGWGGATVGLEDPVSFVGSQTTCTPSCLPSDVPQGTVLTFTPQATPQNPDLVVTALGTVPSTLNAGDSVFLDFEVVNQGSGSAGATRVALMVGLSSPPSDFEMASASVPALTAGNAYSGTLSFSVPAIPGTYFAALVVDPSGAVSETSESNNTYSLGQVSIVGGGSAITITTSSLPGGTLGVPYDSQLQQVGGSSPSWNVISGSLPPGLSLSTGGRITGSPTTEGQYFFVVEASEAGLTPDGAELSINVVNGGTGTITVQPTTLPAATVGAPYSASVSASGGVAPYAFQIISGRPDWLSLDSQGNLSGTPDAAGQHQLTVSVFDAEFTDSIAILTLDVVTAGPLDLVASIPAGVAQRYYDQRVVQGGRPPYQVTVVDGSFPNDLAINAEGYLRGTPSSSGSWQVTVQISDSAGATAAGQVNLRVTELRELSITFSELGVNLRSDVNVELTAEGGVAPYTWSIVQGALQSGLTLVPEGRLMGRVEEASTATVTFSVRDSDGTTATREVQVVARGYRGGGGTTGGGSSRGGCACLRPRDEPWLSVLMAAGLLVLWRRRRGFGSNAA
ncbi:MAG: hypothetical protein KC933_26850 [Myxococcales bacterium]|nr:hypothetical protein [Myxococcales bacterium]